MTFTDIVVIVTAAAADLNIFCPYLVGNPDCCFHFSARRSQLLLGNVNNNP